MQVERVRFFLDPPPMHTEVLEIAGLKYQTKHFYLHTLSITWVSKRSEIPGLDSSARLKAFSSSSNAHTLPPVTRRFSFNYTHTVEMNATALEFSIAAGKAINYG